MDGRGRRRTGWANRQRRVLAALLLAPTAFGAWQAEAQVAVSNETMNFETGRITWNWACADHALLRYRYGTTGSYSIWTIDVGLGTDITTNLITNRDYVEANIQLSPDSGCGTNTINGTTISYTATTLSSNPASLSDTNLNTATLTVTLGDDEVERTGATSPRTWASGAAASHFSLATEAITGLSISNVAGITTGGSTATVTLAFSGEVSAAATVAVQVAAAAHSGANTITSRPVSVAASPGFSVSESSLLLDEAPGAVNAHRGGYEVRINTQPASSCASGVVLTIASDNADITASPSTLTFTNSNYAGPRRVTVLAARDSDSSTDSATLSHTVTTACTPDYPASMTVNSVSVTARDDDRRLVVTPAELALEEGSTGSYTVALGGSPAAGATVRVTATSANPAVRVDSDGTPTTRVLNFTSANWNTAQTVTVTATSDGDAADEFSTIANAAPEAIWQPFDVTVRVADDEESGTDYDTDDDGLIEIATLAHLNAVRWDLDGDGAVDSATNATSYGNAFPNAAADMGCPDGPDADQSADCVGYELAAKLDFDTDGDGDVDGDDPGSYGNWSPIGGTYAGIFDGNGRTISRLTISTTGKAALFDTVTGTVRRLGIVDANVRTTGAQSAGALVADVTNPGQIVACWSSGAVTGTAGTSNVFVGGLVGLLVGSNAKLAASFSTAAVSGTNNGGGLLGGIQEYATVIASYATGTVTANRVGGLVGGALQGLRGDTTLRASYAIGRPTGVGSPPRVGGLVGSITGDVRSIDMYFDSTTTARTNGAGSGTSGTGQTTSQLQTPTSATGIYANWDELDIDGDGVAVEDPWDFGSSTQYPVLSYAGLDTALQFNSQATNAAPSFGSGSVTNQTYRQNHPVSQLQVPAASSGNGALTYTAYGLPAGLSFDSDGSGACSQARTICGSPTTVGNSTVRIVVTDQDDTDASDRDALTFTVNVVNPSARITATNPSPLVEGTLNNATVTVTLANTTFASGVTVSSFMLGTAVPGLTIASVAPVSSGDTTATLTLGYDGSNFDDQRLFGVTVAAAAHALVGDLSTGLVDLFPNRGVTLSASSLLVPENDNADYTVRLASIPFGGNVTVAITGAGSGISASPTSLVFTASNWNTARTVRVSAVDDANPTNEMVTLTHTPTGGGYTGLTAPTLQVTATDDDAPSLRVSPTSLTIAEGRTESYRVRLNIQPSAAVTVTVGGATAKVTVDTDPDTTGDQTELAFDATDWNRWKTVRVTGAEDGDGDDETVSLTHAATGASEYTGLAIGARPGVSVSVVDDDEPTVELSRTSLTLSEGGGTAAEGSWTVRLANLAPTGTVSVAVTSGDPAVELVGAPVTLTFDATTWRTWQMVTARAVDDDNATSERVEVRHTATGANYGDAEAVLRVVVTDDEAPPGAPAGLTATPGDGQATLRWRNPGNPSITRYEYRHAEEGARLGSWRAVPGAGPGTTSLTVSDLVNGRAYQFEVRAGNEIGDSPAARATARLAAAPGATVHLQDAALAAAARAAVGKSASEPLTAGDLATVLELDLSRAAAAAGRWLPPQTADEPLRNLRGIEAMVNLRRLWLDNNAVADIAPLLALRYLVFVSLRGNPLTSDSVYVHAAALRARGVEVLLDAATLATVADPGLRRALEVALGKEPGAALTEGDLLTLSSLRAESAGVASLSGLEAASRLESLTLSGNAPVAGGVAMDLSPLAGLRSLSHLDLSDNDLADVSALGGLTGLRELLLAGNAVRDLSPLAGLTGLRSLTLSNNGLTDISALSGLSQLRQLWLDGNELESVRPLRRLRSLIYLHLGDNRIADISPLASLADLRRLWLPGNRVEDVSALSGLWSLQRLDLSRNQVRDVAPLSRLADLSLLRLGWNRVEDISALSGHRGLTDGGALGLRGNPLGSAALRAQVPELRAAGAAVVSGWAVPLFPAAPAGADPSGPSGFVRVLNRSDVDGVVLVEALDEAGRRFGPVRLALGPRAAAHFNSADLEDGNAAKGMPDGVGRPTRGSWRLAVSSALDIEVLAYLRMPDGFLTAMHGELPRAGESLSAFVFNPGGNRVQRSSLRLHNPGAAEARVWPWGVDDAGRGRLASPLAVAAGVTASVSARSLESSRRGGRGLGNGEGKWRLRLGAPWPLSALGVLESPTGHLSNLSAAPRQAAVAGTLRLPLFPSASLLPPPSSPSGREGFARVANLGPWEGWAEVAAVDDAGVRAGPVRLRLPRRAVVHFNSADLENGNAAKGLPEGVGAPTRGAWRLELSGNVAFAAAAYARHADGFLTSLHETAPMADNAARVAVFNPASNTHQRSLLRLANDGDDPALATITARDDAGAEAGPVSVTVPAGEALTFTAAQLENGGEGIDGALGDGEGKWRLTISFDNALTVMSLMESPAGHLSNLSAATRP